MIIRSQDKKRIANIGTCQLIALLGSCGESQNITVDGMIFGTYSTEEKAIKVLDMICRAYEDFRGGNIYEHSIFNMPQDSEV